MSLADEIKLINEQEESREEHTVDYPSSHLKNSILRLTKNNSRIACRILPAVSADKPTWQPYRELWVTDNNGKNRSYMVTADTRDDSDPLLQALKRWDKTTIKGLDKNGNTKDVSGLYKLSKYGNFPSLRYYLNVIPLEIRKDKNGIPYYAEVVKNGNYEVHMLTITSGLLNNIVSDLQDPMHNPNLLNKTTIDKLNQQPNVNITQEQIDNSFISDIFAYPVVFSRMTDGKKVTYSMELQQQRPLRPLNSSWKEQAEDLPYQATPSYKYNEHWVNDLITRIDHELGLTSHVEPPKQEVIPQGQTTQVNTKMAQSAQKDPFASKAVKVGVPNDTGSTGQTDASMSGQTQSTPAPQAAPTQPAPAPSSEAGSKVMEQFPNMPNSVEDIPEDDVPFGDDTKTDTTQSTLQSTNSAPQANDSVASDVDDLIKDMGLDKI